VLHIWLWNALESTKTHKTSNSSLCCHSTLFIFNYICDVTRLLFFQLLAQEYNADPIKVKAPSSPSLPISLHHYMPLTQILCYGRNVQWRSAKRTSTPNTSTSWKGRWWRYTIASYCPVPCLLTPHHDSSGTHFTTCPSLHFLQ